ncbi:TolC family protein [Pedobacter sp. SD-b]|uniref:TolC family protein n=1 Tax=Pedobacter segetis TaxID=2793069 RepID=A0ABS1BI88_9SPHI|nr:TolC family protein [Pedobacter segetis]MBK0382527.1 TolC family protein [Pedobacter segetis]
MLYTKKIIFTLSLMLMSSVIFAQNILSLDSVISIIKTNNPELKVYQEQMKSQDALVGGASAWMAPMLGVGTFMTPYNNFSRPENQQDGSIMLVAEQKIPNRSKIKTTEAYLKAQSNITKQLNADNFNDLRALARSNYYEVLTIQKSLDYLTKNLQVLQNLKKLAEIRYTYNKAGLAQIYSLQAKIYETENKISSAKAKIDIGKIKLNTLMNRDNSIDFLIDTAQSFTAYMMQNDLTEAINNRSSIKMVNEQINSLNLKNKMIATEAKPEFSIQFNHMQTYNTSRPNQFSLMGSLSIPIAPWASKSYQSKLKANQFEVAAMQYQKENATNNLLGLIATQQKHLMHMQMELSVYRDKILPAMQKSYEVLLLNYQENKEELNTVLTAFKELNDSQLNYLMLLNEYYQTQTEYERNVEI